LGEDLAGKAGGEGGREGGRERGREGRKEGGGNLIFTLFTGLERKEASQSFR